MKNETIKMLLYSEANNRSGEDDLRGVIRLFAEINNISLKSLKEEIDFILNYECDENE